MTYKIITTRGISTWKCGSLRTKITTEKNGEYTSATFSGYNPFPCFSMITKYSTVAKWLKNNGWEQYGYITAEKIIEEIDSETGEILFIEHTIKERQV